MKALQPKPLLIGRLREGPRDGQSFQHTEDMRQVKLPKLAEKGWVVYAWDAEMSAEEGERIYVYAGVLP